MKYGVLYNDDNGNAYGKASFCRSRQGRSHKGDTQYNHPGTTQRETTLSKPQKQSAVPEYLKILADKKDILALV